MRVKEIRLMMSMPEWKTVSINPEVKKDYEALGALISQLEKEVSRLTRENEKYREIMGDSIASRSDKKEEEPRKTDGLMKRAKA